MCTLTVIPWNAGVRVKCNRDESRLRAAARPPQMREFGNRRALLPIDPVSDGTWIAATDAGLVFVLMNVYGPMRASPLVMVGTLRREPTISRGRIIPHLAQANSLGDAVRLAQEMDAARYEPFRLVVLNRGQYMELLWSGDNLTVAKLTCSAPAAIERPLFFTSSGLGDEIQRPRERLFAELFTEAVDVASTGEPSEKGGQSHFAYKASQNRDSPRQFSDTLLAARQDEFHHFAWPDNPKASVWMTRREAMTVSCTTVELTANRVAMDYEARVDDSTPVHKAERLTLPVGV